jgi:16S rRNA (cytosine967-C5)-methyltransferase
MTDADKAQDRELGRVAAGKGAPLGALVLDLWQATRMDWGFVSDRLAGAFRARRALGGRERRFVAETIYGMVRHARRIDEALRLGGLRPKSAPPDHERLVAYLVLEAELGLDEAVRLVPAVDWTAAAAVDQRIAQIADPVKRIALAASLPDFLAAQLHADHGDRAEAIAHALNQRAPMTVRANRLLVEPDALIAELAAAGLSARPGDHAGAAIHVETRTNLFGLEAFKGGRFEAQDEGSQLIAELVAPPPRGLVVDFCAGAGGKTLALAAALENRGRVLACDVDPRKLAELKRRARRATVTTAQAIELGGEPKAPLPAPLVRVEGKADRVLVDAPCTGVGSLRRNPELRFRLSPADLTRLPVQQLEICERALALLAPGGRLIYATCTVLHAENRAVVAALLARHPTLEEVPAKEVWGAERARALGDADGRYLEVTPDRHGTDGFFAAIVRRRR